MRQTFNTRNTDLSGSSLHLDLYFYIQQTTSLLEQRMKAKKPHHCQSTVREHLSSKGQRNKPRDLPLLRKKEQKMCLTPTSYSQLTSVQRYILHTKLLCYLTIDVFLNTCYNKIVDFFLQFLFINLFSINSKSPCLYFSNFIPVIYRLYPWCIYENENL